MHETTQIHSSSKKSWMNRALNRLRKQDPILIVPYRGYANASRIFIKGRVLEDKGITLSQTQSTLRNLVNSFKRFESDEVAGARIGIRVGQNYFERITDREGYFDLDEVWIPPEDAYETCWVYGRVELLDLTGRPVSPTHSDVQILYPCVQPEWGIISDIDDTVLRTYVTSRFFWKMLYVTFFKNAYQRRPVKGMVKLLQELTLNAKSGRLENPIFYVSDSPWNIYDLLTNFMQLQKLPKGPVLLRDYGLFPASRPKDYRGHKMHSISHILRMYPDTRFMLFGDSGGKDADIYLTLAREFPDQIGKIYIRKTGDTPNARRVERLVRECDYADITMTYT